MIYIPEGVCSQQIELEINEGLITKLNIKGGCHGNLQGITRLLLNRPAKEAADTLLGVDCRGRGTSCPDQIAKAIYACLNEEAR